MSIVYNTNIVRNGLVLYLDAANPKSYPGTGTAWNDLSGNGNNGTLINGVGYSAANNGSMLFDGADDYVDCGNSTILDIKRTISLEAWFKVGSLAFSNGWSNLISKMDTIGGVASRSYSAFINTSGYIHFCSADVSGQQVYDTPTFIQLNTWYHWVGTIDRNLGIMKQFVNTSIAAQGSLRLTDTVTNTEPVCVNFRGSTTYNRFLGSVPSTRIYNRVLSDIEIQQNFEATRGRYGI